MYNQEIVRFIIWTLHVTESFCCCCCCSEVTGIVCLSTTATLSPTRWLSSWQAGLSRPTSLTFHLKSSLREWNSGCQLTFASFESVVLIMSLLTTAHPMTVNVSHWNLNKAPVQRQVFERHISRLDLQLQWSYILLVMIAAKLWNVVFIIKH